MIAIAIAAALAAAATPGEKPIEAKGPLAPLAGTLRMPDVAKPPVVLILPGSGPTDRDGNNPAGLKAAPYRLIAEGLAQRGIASVRIDKRGIGGSRAAVDDPNAVTISDYAADTHAWIDAIRARTGASCVWLLGHSEGGLIALAAGQQPSGICGVLLVSTPGRRLTAILREQLRANPANAPLLGQAEAALDAIEAGKNVDVTGFSPPLLRLFHPAVQGFLIDASAHDPAKLIASLRLPVLILQGRRDLQVSEADARLLASASAGAKLVLLPDTNHVLKSVAVDDRAANIATYADSALPLAPGVIDALAGFIGSNTDAR